MYPEEYNFINDIHLVHYSVESWAKKKNAFLLNF